jgi:hypothetical protein
MFIGSVSSVDHLVGSPSYDRPEVECEISVRRQDPFVEVEGPLLVWPKDGNYHSIIQGDV